MLGALRRMSGVRMAIAATRQDLTGARRPEKPVAWKRGG
jgi:hypothetical protein